MLNAEGDGARVCLLDALVPDPIPSAQIEYYKFVRKVNRSPPQTSPMNPSSTASGGGALPRWKCQNCRHALCVTGADTYASASAFPDPSRSVSASSSSVLGASSLDQSFVVLSRHPKPPPRPLDQSFVLLPHAAASIYNSDAAPPRGSSSISTIEVLNRAFDIATSQIQVEQPLCLECMRVLSDKMDKEVEDVNRDIKAYDACLERPDLEKVDMLSDAEFLRGTLKIEEEEKRLLAQIEETEKQFLEFKAEMEDLESKSKLFKEEETRYWHEFNNFQFQLTAHQEVRDANLAKIEVSQAHIELLKRTNVLNDAFLIENDGEFGTINNFRLGRLSAVPVEWDEINAAWGQACLLLHTMAQHFRPKLPYHSKIIPMGSYPRIMDSKGNTFELFGPVNLFWSTRYDKAMQLFLTCIEEFAEFATDMDIENKIPLERHCRLPYKIVNDTVATFSIRQSFSKSDDWTKALKYTLCDLKWLLFWFVGNTSFQPLCGVSSHAEAPKI